MGAGRLAARASRAPRTAIRPPGGVYCHVAGCDLVRDADGSWKVLEDNVRTPSGISYVLENRRRDDAPAARSCSPTTACARSTTTRSCCSTALREVAPRAEERADGRRLDARARSNSAYFEHAFLARQMGVELVEASDLVVRDDVLLHAHDRGPRSACTRSTAASTTTSSTRSSSAPTRCSACPGLMRAYRAGHGRDRQRGRHRRRRRQGDLPLRAGDDPLLPRRGADPRQRPDLPAAPTPSSASTCSTGSTSSSSSRPASRAARASSSARGRPTRRLAAPAAADRRAARALDRPGARAALHRARPRCPTGALAPRHVDLRPFAVFGDDIHIVPGGLTRVALREGSMIVNSSQGGGSKDTWVLEDGRAAGRAGAAIPSRRGRRRRCPDLRYAAAPGPASSSSSSSSRADARPDRPRAVLDRPHARARRAHRAHARRRLPRRPAGPPGRPRRRAPELGRRCWRSWAPSRRGALGRRATRSCAGSRSTATTRPRSLSCVAQRARGRAHGPRRLLGRDVGGDQHDRTSGSSPSDLATRCAPARTRSTPTSASAAGCSGASPTARCCATRRTPSCRPAAAIEAADMVLRMLRVALPAAGEAARPTRATARRSRCCRRSAASRPTGARSRRRRTRCRSRASCSTSATTRTRVAASVDALHDALTAADERARTAAPVLRLGRLTADLEFRSARGRRGARRRLHARAPCSSSSRWSTPTSPSATSAGTAAPPLHVA